MNGTSPKKRKAPGAFEHRKICLIGGSSFQQSALFASLETKYYQVNTSTVSKLITYKESADVIFVNRHTSGSKEYDMPHEIDHRAIWSLLAWLKPDVVIGLCSVGSLCPELLPCGSLCLPTDWLNANFAPAHYHSDHRAHVKPQLSLGHREVVLRALQAEQLLPALFPPARELVYVQTQGPRFETRAEVRLLARFGEVVGMTAGDEATMACETGIPYFMLCVVDNVGHGLDADSALDNMDNFKLAQKQNVAKLERACMLALHALVKTPLPKELHLTYVHRLIYAKYIATVDLSDRVITNGVVALDVQGQIVAVHAADGEASPKYSAPHVTQLNDHLLTPGLVNAHTHAAMCLMRGFGDDLEMTTWLITKIWPAEAKCVSPEFVRFGTTCAVEEMLSSGTTCFLDFYFFPEEIAKVCGEAGMRVVVGMPVIAFPNAMAKDGGDHLRLAQEQFEKAEQYGDLVSFGIAPHAMYSVDESDVVKCKQLAAQHGAIFHTHLHETREEVESSLALNTKSPVCHRCNQASTPLANLDRLQLLDRTCSFAHCCHLSSEEIALLAAKECSVVHCPSSNLKLASGFCPTAKLVDAGVNVCIGTDGACSNNSLDMLAEMKLVALLGKGVAQDATKLSCRQVLRMATLNGAKALGLEAKIGSIEVGKSADLMAVEITNRNACRPVFDPVATLVYSATKDCVSHVWVRGEPKVVDFARVGPLLSEREMRHEGEKWEQIMRNVEAELNEV